MGKSVVSCFLTHGVEFDGKPVGSASARARTYGRTHGRTHNPKT